MNAAMFFHIDFPEFIARWGHMQISKVKTRSKVSRREPNMTWGQKDIRNNDGTMKLFLRRHRDMLGKRWLTGMKMSGEKTRKSQKLHRVCAAATTSLSRVRCGGKTNANLRSSGSLWAIHIICISYTLFPQYNETPRESIWREWEGMDSGCFGVKD